MEMGFHRGCRIAGRLAAGRDVIKELQPAADHRYLGPRSRRWRLGITYADRLRPDHQVARSYARRNRNRTSGGEIADAALVAADISRSTTACSDRCPNPVQRLRLQLSAPRCAETRATIVLRKIDAARRPVRQIELCGSQAHASVARERVRGLEIFDRRD
jgi:hypothetical protein